MLRFSIKQCRVDVASIQQAKSSEQNSNGFLCVYADRMAELWAQFDLDSMPNPSHNFARLNQNSISKKSANNVLFRVFQNRLSKNADSDT